MINKYYNYINNLNEEKIINQIAKEYIEKYINCLETNPSRFIENCPKHLILEVKNILNEAGIFDEGLNILIEERILKENIQGV